MILNIHTIIVVNPAFQDMCKRPYPGHPKGCPNYGQRAICPPRQRLLFNIFDCSIENFHLIYVSFDLASHVKRMKEKHPKWTDKQLKCCLYWQGTARKDLRKEIQRFKKIFHVVTEVLEAMGVNVTKLMEDNANIKLEWPPENIVYKVALAGRLK